MNQGTRGFLIKLLGNYALAEPSDDRYQRADRVPTSGKPHPQCGFSARAAQILQHVGVPFAHVNIFEDPEIREGLKVYSNWPTFPQLYIKGELIGGSDIMMDLFEKGELQPLLEAAVKKDT